MADVRIDRESQQRLDRLTSALNDRRLVEGVVRHVDREGRRMASRLKKQNPFRSSTGRGSVRGRHVPTGRLGGIEISAEALLRASGGGTFSIRKEEAAPTPAQHPNELERIDYREGRRNPEVVGGLYELADLARSRVLIEIPTRFLLARQIALAPALLRHRVERMVPGVVRRLDRYLRRRLDPR